MSARGFAHDALVYTDPADLITQSADFLRAGLADGARAVAFAPPATADPLRSAVGADLRVLDMPTAGGNPARIIPALRELISSDEPVVAICQAWWPGRSAAQSAEVALHEALVDIAFADGPDLRVRCPYPARGAEWVPASHREIVSDGAARGSGGYDPDLAAATFSAVLDDTTAEVTDVTHFSLDDLPELRDLVTIRASAAGLDRDKALDLTLAANEIVTNSICHGGERGTLRVWGEDGAVVCEVSDSGHLDSAMTGRVAPLPSVRGGRGIWLANQLCDLVQIRSCPKRGTVVRLWMHG
jgi:anti-sigma regulatory factor (Ser/Thr protein kinase)